MGITDFVNRLAVQTVVYWGSPVRNGFGNKTFADPIELSVRYEQAPGLVKEADGQEVVLRSRMFLIRDFSEGSSDVDIDEGGYIYLGELSDIDDSSLGNDTSNPASIEGAEVIESIRKLPLLGSTDKFFYRVNLNLTSIERL